MGISWYKVSITGNPKATVQGRTIHPPVLKVQRFTGRFQRRFAPRNDMVFRFSMNRYRCVVVMFRRGQAPALLSIGPGADSPLPFALLGHPPS